MDERIKESISALMDGEANELEFQRVLSHADQEEVLAVWKNYYELKAVLQPEKSSLGMIDISQSVAAAIAKESPLDLTGEHNSKPLDDVGSQIPTILPDTSQAHASYTHEHALTKPPSNVTKYSGGLAVAASLFIALVFVLQNGLNGSVDSLDNRFTAEVAVQNTAEITEFQKTNQLAVVPSHHHKQPKIIVEFTEEHAQRFNEYLLRHAEHSVASSQAGMMPLARVASVNAVGI